MRNLLVLFLISILTFSFMTKVDARRFGGGRSFGITRSTSSFSRAAIPPRFNSPSSTPNRWLGPLAGFAAGGLLASLFMGHGFGGGIMSWVLIFGVGYLLLQFFRNKMQPMSYPNQYNKNLADPMNETTDSHLKPLYPQANIPVGFSKEDLLRTAKAQFIRLQAAYDAKNLADIREFTTPEVFAEISLQLQERGDVKNETEVVSLNAELLNTEADAQGTLTTIRFTGSIKEEGVASDLNEIWHFKKAPNVSTWIVAGVQQD